MSKPTSYSYLFDRYRLTEKELLYEGHGVHLSPIQFDVLRFLVTNHGQFFTSDKLVDSVLRGSSADRNNIEQAISDLRGKLHDDSKKSRFILTRRGSGYSFIADVRKVADDDLDSVAAEPNRVVEDLEDEMSTFEDWLRGPGSNITRVLIGALVLTVLVTIGLSVGEKNERWAKTSACLAQFIVVLGLFVDSWRQRKSAHDVLKNAIRCNKLWETEKARNIARSGLGQYEKYWQWLLVSWLALYLFLSLLAYLNLDLSQLMIDHQPRGYALSIILTFFNNLNTLMILCCFYVLNKEIENEEERRDIRDILLVVIGVVLLIVTMFQVILLAPIEKEIISGAASLVSGVVGGIAMALYVGRLQSKFLGPPLWLLIGLYSYTAIQPLFTQLEKNTTGTTILLDFALFLKCLLYLYMAWLFQSGRLLFYLREVRVTYKEVEAEWQEFRKPLLK